MERCGARIASSTLRWPRAWSWPAAARVSMTCLRPGA